MVNEYEPQDLPNLLPVRRLRPIGIYGRIRSSQRCFPAFRVIPGDPED